LYILFIRVRGGNSIGTSHPRPNGYGEIFTIQMFDRMSARRITSPFRDTAMRVSCRMK
jgi:hypothetical protein